MKGVSKPPRAGKRPPSRNTLGDGTKPNTVESDKAARYAFTQGAYAKGKK
jgi:hypothetical protein